MAMRQVRGRNGEILMVAAARAKDARRSNVHWLTPRTWRRWADVGLRGHGRDGVPEPGWAGRLEDRNVAFTRLLVSSGLRRAEGGSLLTFEVPTLQLDGGRYYHGKVAAQVTRSKRARTFYLASDAVGEIESYVDSSRSWAVRAAQRKGRYERLSGLRLVTKVTRQDRPSQQSSPMRRISPVARPARPSISGMYSSTLSGQPNRMVCTRSQGL